MPPIRRSRGEADRSSHFPSPKCGLQSPPYSPEAHDRWEYSFEPCSSLLSIESNDDSPPSTISSPSFQQVTTPVSTVSSPPPRSHRRYLAQLRPLRQARILYTLEQCLHICASKQFARALDGQPVTDDTVWAIMVYRCGVDAGTPTDCARLLEYLLINRSDQKNGDVQGIWSQMAKKSLGWQITAQRDYWEWMEYMRSVWMG